MAHVLIIEDEPFTAFAIELALGEAGAETFDTADTEENAVALARAHRPDVITSDLALRQGRGSKAIDTIRREMGDVPVIYLTGSPEACAARGLAASVLSKPFDQRALVDAYKRARAA